MALFVTAGFEFFRRWAQRQKYLIRYSPPFQTSLQEITATPAIPGAPPMNGGVVRNWAARDISRFSEVAMRKVKSTGVRLLFRSSPLRLTVALLLLLAVGCSGITQQASQGASTGNETETGTGNPPPQTPPPPVVTNTPEKANASLFGMHIHRIDAGTPWPTAPVPWIRLWDSGVAWKDIQPQRGIWDFSRMDALVLAAQQHQTKLLYTFGITPQWASSQPSQPGNYGPGTAAVPANITDWQNFVAAVAQRYRGKISAYEILNEPNLPGYFTGTVDDQLKLIASAYETVKTIDPQAIVLSPGYQGSGFKQLDQLLSMGASKYFDAIAYHFYQFPAYPETQLQFIQTVRAVLNKYSLTSPMWDTEIGFGPTQTFTSDDQQAAYFARTILVHWIAGVEHVFWYAWDNHGWVHLWMTEPDGVTLTKAGVAYGVLESWIIGSTLNSCSDNNGLHICSLALATGGQAHMVWLTSGTETFTLPADWSASTVSTLDGTSAQVGATIQVGEEPLLLQ